MPVDKRSGNTKSVSKSKSASEAIAHVIDILVTRYLPATADEEPVCRIGKFFYAWLASFMFFCFVLIFYLSSGAGQLPAPTARLLSESADIIYIIGAVFLVPIVHGIMVSYIKEIGRIRAYLLGLFLPAVTVYVVSTAARIFVV